MHQVAYAPVFAACPCGCNQIGWFVFSANGWRSQYSVNAMAAGTAARLLNEGRITEDDLNVMWSLQSDWDEMADVVEVADTISDTVTMPHMN